jgi:hypothetical protein
MGFVWTDTPLVVSSTKIKTIHVTELQTNIDTDRVAVALAAYSWEASPTPNKSIITTSRYGDMVTALDEAYDANFCSGHCDNHNVTAKDPHKATAWPSHMVIHMGTKHYSSDKSIPHFSDNEP